MTTTPRTAPGVVTADNAAGWAGQAGFGEFQKKGTTRISLRPVPPGTSFQTPEGLRAEDEECRIAFDVQGGVYPIRESVFQRSYGEAEAALAEAVAVAVALLARLTEAIQTANIYQTKQAWDKHDNIVDEARAFLATHGAGEERE